MEVTYSCDPDQATFPLFRDEGELVASWAADKVEVPAWMSIILQP